MTAPSYTTIRENALSAILAITQTGQSVSADGRTLTLADLGDLQALVKWCDKHIGAASRGGVVRSIAVVPRA